MTQNQKDKFLKRVVLFSLITSAVFIASGMALAVAGYETIEFVVAACGVFGGELTISCVIKLMGEKIGSQPPKKRAPRP